MRTHAGQIAQPLASAEEYSHTRTRERRSILVVGPTPPPVHGVAVAIQDLLQSRLRERFELLHLELADRRGIEHVNKPDWHDVVLFLRQWKKLVHLLIMARPHMTYLVVSQSSIGFMRDSLLLLPAYLGGSRIVLHLHGGNFREWFHERSWLMKLYVRVMLRLVSRVIVLGDSLKAQFEGLIAPHRVAVVPNGIEWQCSPRPVISRGRQRRFCVLHLSTLSHLKGALVLLRAVPSVLRCRQDVEFVFAGSWSHEEDRQWAERFIEQQGIEGHVRFTGQVVGEHKQSLYQSADVFVFPGVQQEGQPLVVLEAMAAGVPVVYTDRGCLNETVGDGQGGLCINANDAPDLAKAVLWLLDHEENRAAMGRAGRKRYEALFTRDRHVSSMIQVFEQVGEATAHG